MSGKSLGCRDSKPKASRGPLHLAVLLLPILQPAALGSAHHPPPRPTPSYGGKLRPRPHSKFPGPEPAMRLHPPPAPSSNLDTGWTPEGLAGGIPRAQAAFQPATSASDLSATKPSSQHRDVRVCLGPHSNPIPTGGLAGDQVMPALGCGGAPSPNLA